MTAWAPNDMVVYVCCYIVSGTAQDVVLGVGSDDGYKLYLNGELIKRVRVFRGAVPDQKTYSVHLNQGGNLLLLKLTRRPRLKRVHHDATASVWRAARRGKG